MSAYIQKLMSEWSYKAKFLCPLQWELIQSDKTAKMMFHAGAIIDDYLYVHGGSSTVDQFSSPTNNFYRFHLKNNRWENLSKCSGNPSLSNHACVVFGKKYLVFVGGWDGQKCQSNIHMFHTKKKLWTTANSTGLPEEMEGVACHSANLIHTTEDMHPNILVLVSNTKVRKHHTLAFNLSPNKELTSWSFTKLPNRVTFQLDHSALSIGKNTLHCIGGNVRKLLQKIHVYHIAQNPKDKLVSALITHVADNKFNSLSAMSWPKEVCRGQAAISGRNGFLFLNGIKYVTNPIDFTKNVYIYLNLGTKRGVYYVGDIAEKMSFGVCATDPQTGFTYYHGGINTRTENVSRIFKLNFVFRDIRRGLSKR